MASERIQYPEPLRITASGRLMGVSILGGAACGVASLLTQMHPFILAHPLATLGLSGAAALVGGFVGMLTFMFVYPLLRYKHLPHVIPVAYVPTGFAVVAVSVYSPIYAVAMGPLVLLGMCIIAKVLLPEIVSRYSVRQCRECGYDMRAHAFGSACPECGTAWVDADAFRHMVIDRSVNARRASRAAWAMAAVAFVIAFITWLPYKPMRQSNFEAVTPGMTQKEVRGLLGKPHQTSRSLQGNDVWAYGLGLPDVWRVTFADGVVVGSGITDGW